MKFLIILMVLGATSFGFFYAALLTHSEADRKRDDMEQEEWLRKIASEQAEKKREKDKGRIAGDV